MSQYVSNPEETKELLPRYRIFYGFLLLTFVMFFMRLWYLQIIEGSELREFSEKNRIKQNKILAPRGLILDREGRVLVENHPGFEAVLSPLYVKDESSLARTLSPLLSMTDEQIVQRIQRSKKQNGPFAPIKVKENLTKDEVFRLKRIRLETPGLDIRETVVRYYPLREVGAQLFGYVGEISRSQLPKYNQMYKGDITFDQGDIIGKAGLEESLERRIRGVDGIQFVQVDAFGREIRAANTLYGEQIQSVNPTPGQNVVLTLDRDIQEATWRSFAEQKRIGGVVALKSDGEVLAWVSAPSFDPNEFSTRISPQMWNSLINDPFKPLRNKVVQDFFPPGSTFKSFVGLAALEEKVIDPSTQIYCPGSIQFGRRTYHDHLKGGHGNVTIFEAMERSSNVFFYKMGIALGIDKMHAYINPFGIGLSTGIDVPQEQKGLMPSSQWKKDRMGEEWQPGENLSNAIGQGFVAVTPLQLAIAYNTIALEGKVMKPFVVKKVMDQEGKVVSENVPTVVRDLTETQATGIKISPHNFKVIKKALRKVVQGERGTAKLVNIPGADIAGKTGTTQVMSFSADQIYAKCENRPIHQRHHGWFVAFAPADNPEITVAALAEHSCFGSRGAGPVVRDVMRAYFAKYHPDRIAEYLKKTAVIHVENPSPPEGE